MAEIDFSRFRMLLRNVLDTSPNFTATSLARALGRDGSYIRDFLNGKKDTLGAIEIDRMEDLLRVSLGRSYRSPATAPAPADAPPDAVDRPLQIRPPPSFFEGRTLPLYASAEGGDGALIVDYRPIEYVERPYSLRSIDEGYAIVITGDSMAPAFKPGQRAWVNPRLPWLRGEEHIFRSEDNQTGDWRALIKELVNWTDSKWKVLQHNPGKTYDLERGEWQVCHRVVGRFNRE